MGEDIRKATLLIETDEILAEKQAVPSEGLSDVDEALWHAKSSALLLRMCPLYHIKSNKNIVTMDTETPCILLRDKLPAKFGMSLAKVWATLIRELCELKMDSAKIWKHL